MKQIFITLVSIFILTISDLSAQNCINCNNPFPLSDTFYRSKVGFNNIVNGHYAFAAGENSTADGNRSFAFGFNTQALGNTSFSFGNSCISYGLMSFSLGMASEATGDASFAIGSKVKSRYTRSFAIGSGPAFGMMENLYMETMMIGFNSVKPTLFISRPENDVSPYDKTGKVAIGDITRLGGEPSAKLHILADDGEEAAIFIEPYNWSAGEAGKIILGDTNHFIKTSKSIGMEFTSQNNFIFSGINVGIGISQPNYKLDVAGDINFSGDLFSDGVLFKESQWDQTGDNISFITGKVGIGTTNFVEDYGLYVNNGILTSEVMIKDPSVWYDYVFERDYKLIKITDLELFITANKHLPGVPSEEEVTKDGFGLAEMNGILLKKVEELTLYIIEQQKQISNMNNRLNEMENHSKK